MKIDNQNNINNGFRNYIANQMNKVDNLIKANLPNYAYGIHVLKIKCELYNYLQQKTIALLKNNNMMLNPKNKSLCITTLENINHKITEKEKEMVNIIDTLQHTLQNENKKNIANSNDILKENENLKSSIKEHIKNTSVLEENNKLLLSKYGKMQQENEVMTSQLLKSAYKLASNNNPSNSISHLKQSSSLSVSPSQKKLTKSFVNINNSYRQLSQEGLLELINEMYKAKNNSNKKNNSIGKPLETMEQFMYIFLQNKYGLKNLITEVASSIIASIKEYAKVNNEIRLFGLILQNEIEEKSIQILYQIKRILNESLIMLIQLDNPYKNKDEINDIVSKLKKTFLQEDIWLKIINLVFQKDKNAEETVTKQVYEYINSILNKSLYITNSNYNTLTRSEKELFNGMKTYQKKITYKDLFNIILGYHLKSRDVFLKKFKITFKQIDNSNKGILTKTQFYTLIINLNLYDNDDSIEMNIDNLIMKLPYCETYDSFSFSEIVDLLENEISPKSPSLNCLEFISSSM